MQPARVRQRILDETAALGVDPTPPHSRMIRGRATRLCRIRVGQYRVAYWVDHDDRVVHVTKVGHRQGFYS
ncbi:MAG: type II toxin-antitoxin system RelE/ParE family toxin [Acidobacteria bacterium]|nr:type II toxin-antitoxin system RelE/ParE family toxin [Acidobacteriota bacterium]